MRSWKTLFTDKRWLFVLGIIAFAIIASLFERFMRASPQPSAAPPQGAQQGARKPDERPPPRLLPDEFEGTLAPVEQSKPEPAPPVPLILHGVRTGDEEDYDRVVFDFVGDRPPGFRVEYVDKLARKCGSDDLKAQGSTWLLVRINPAVAHQESGRTTLSGIEFDENLKTVKYIRQICDVDGQLEWLIEVSARKPYRAEPLSEPARLVIDIKH